MNDKREIHVERREVYDVVITTVHDGVQERKQGWLHATKQEAVERADRMFKNKLATERGEDIL
jgi:hypothetical protein